MAVENLKQGAGYGLTWSNSDSEKREVKLANSSKSWETATVLALLEAGSTSYSNSTLTAGDQVQVVPVTYGVGQVVTLVAPPPAPQYTVPAAPSCEVVAPNVVWGAPELADAFKFPSPFLGLNRDDNAGDGGVAPQAGFNAPVEVEAFSSSMVLYDPTRGLVLTAKPQTGTTASGTAYTILSSCVSSEGSNNPEGGGETGFPNITEFGFMVPTEGQLALEIAATSPNGYVQGLDLGLLWASDAEGKVEWDGEEDFGYVGGAPGQWGSAGALINHLTGTSQGHEAYNQAWQFDGNEHIHTILLDGDTNTVSRCVDKALVDSYPIPTGLPAEYMWLIISLAFRNAFPGQGPVFTGTIEIPVRYIACWSDKQHQGVGILGGGVAPGTTIT